ncbi:MAG: DNA mismatch repair protein MutS, partial [Flavobacteriaceae bacterium]
MAVFKIGDWVEALDDDFKGRVTAIHGKIVQVTGTDGFPMEFPKDSLVKMPSDGGLRVTHHEAALAKEGKEVFRKKPP